MERVVLELDDDSRALLREGRVTGGKGSDIEVLWADGEAAKIRLGRREGRIVMAVPQGSLRHLALTHPTELRSRLRSSPATVFALALGDEGSAVPGRKLVELVQQAVPDEDASAAWRRANREFESRTDVKATGKGASKRYQRVPDQHPDTPDTTGFPATEPAPGLLTPRAASVPPAHGDERPDEDHALVPDATADGEEERPTEPSSATSPIDESKDIALQLRDLATEPGPRDAEPDPRIARQPAAVRLIHAALVAAEPLPGETRLAAQVMRSPLSAGVALAGLDEKTLAAASSHLGRHAWMLICTNRKSSVADTVDAEGLIGADGVAGLIANALVELRTSGTSEVASGARRTAGRLFERLLASPSVRRLPPTTILEAGRLTSRPAEARAEVVVAAVAAAFRTQGTRAWTDLSSVARAELARVVASARLNKDGGRLPLLTWLWSVDPKALEDALWWRNVDLDQFSVAGISPLARALEHPRIRKDIVRPVVLSALREATTRRQLMHVLSLPKPVASVLEPSEVQGALERIWGADEPSRSWLAVLSQEPERTNLRQQVQHLESESDARRRVADAAQARAIELEGRLQVLAERLRVAEVAATELRDSQERQIRLDALRALAGVGAYLDSVVGTQEPSRIRDRVRAKLAAEGLVIIGEAGAAAPFDPQIHDLVHGTLTPGDPVIVSAVGYRLDSSADPGVVLVRALVEPQTEGRS